MLMMKKSFLFKLVFEGSVKDSHEVLVCNLTLHPNSVRLASAYRTLSCNAEVSTSLQRL